MDDSAVLRHATHDDAAQVLRLWQLLFDGMGATPATDWTANAGRWFTDRLDADDTRLPVVELAGRVVATAVGTIELGVPNPYSPQGRGVKLSNVVTLPDHRGRGHGSALVRDVVDWARRLGADRVDLSATDDGYRIYERAGFVRTSSPRMKLQL